MRADNDQPNAIFFLLQTYDWLRAPFEATAAELIPHGGVWAAHRGGLCWGGGGGERTTRVMANMTVAVLLISVTMLATCATSMGTACATAGATCRLLTPMNCRCAGTELRSQQARRQNRCDGVRGGVEETSRG